MAVRGTGEPETLSYDVLLNKDSALGLGITVAGYVCEQGTCLAIQLYASNRYIDVSKRLTAVPQESAIYIKCMADLFT